MSETNKRILPESLLALLKGRRSIRLYRPDPVPDEMVNQVLEAGRWAPSAANRQPWSFIVVRDDTIRRQVAQHASLFFIRWVHVEEAPLLIVLCGDGGSPVDRPLLRENLGLAGCQTMLQAKALGLGSCWIGALDRKAIADVLKVPDQVEIVALLTVGFPAEDPPPPPRKALAEIVHYEVYGNRMDDGNARPGRLSAGPLGILLRRLRLPIRV